MRNEYISKVPRLELDVQYSRLLHSGFDGYLVITNCNVTDYICTTKVLKLQGYARGHKNIN